MAAGPTQAIREQCPLATVNNDGLMSAGYAAQVEQAVAGMVSMRVYDNATRPAAGAVGAVAGVTAVSIWNSDDKAPNFSDGMDWYDAAGNLT